MMNRFVNSKLLLVCLAGFGAVIVALAVFKVPLGNLTFFAIFLACPLIHLFIMKGHGNRGDHKEEDDKQTGKACH